MQDTFLQVIDQISLTMKETFSGTIHVKHYHYKFLKINDAIKESPYSTKIKYIC